MRRQDVSAARADLAAFAALIGWPLTDTQAAALRLEKRQTVIVASRQAGKSRSLAVLAAWWAYRNKGATVLVISAGDEASTRLLRTVRSVAEHPLLAGSIVDESRSRMILTNGSTVLSVPASERQIRGHSVDLLICDEAALIDDDLLMGAALPTTAARPNAKVVLASSPWSDSGAFHGLAMAGSEENPYTQTFRWALADTPWITEAVRAAAQATLSPLRYQAEYEGKFVGASNSLFPRADIVACTADFVMRRSGTSGESVALGLDWGRMNDRHALVAAGQLQDFGVNQQPVLIVPWVETSQRLYGLQVEEVVRVAKCWRCTAITSETNGVGSFPSEELGRLLPGKVKPVASSSKSKEDLYGRLAALLATRGLVLPQDPELLRQLGGLVARGTPSGNLRIEAASESTHDDLPDALSLALAGIPQRLTAVPLSDVPDDDTEWDSYAWRGPNPFCL